MKQPKIIHSAPHGADWQLILPIWLITLVALVGVILRFLR